MNGCKAALHKMKLICLLLVTCISCQALPQFFQAADDVLTDDAIEIKVDRDAIQKDTNVHITIDVQNTFDESAK